MKKVSYDATVKALHELRAGWIRSGIKYAIVANALEMLDNQHEALACKDAAIAEQARQLKEALAALERVKRERNAAVYDLTSYHGDCKTCRHMVDTSDSACRACSNGKDNNWTWRGPCAENGGENA